MSPGAWRALIVLLFAGAAQAGDDPANAPQQAVPVGPPPPGVEAPQQPIVQDVRDGIGTEARPGMTVIVHYTGWLFDPAAAGQQGRKFDSSRDTGHPFIFTLGAGRVIRGWDLGVAGMRIGGLRRLVIPPALAYGSRGVGNGLIPPNSTLLFEIELLGFATSDAQQNVR